MTQDDFGMVTAVFAIAALLAACLGWRGGNARRDVSLLGGAGAMFGAASALPFAT